MKKRYYVKIELELHAITCPGVWLCPNGYIEVTIKCLGYFFKAGPMEPKFPILCHDLFIMEGYFKSLQCSGELENVLGNESIEIILWQNGRRLAYYFGKLGTVLHPAVPRMSCSHHINVQVLMIPSHSFPGIIGPKIEMSGRTIVQNNAVIKKCIQKCDEFHMPLVMPYFTNIERPNYHNHDKKLEFKRQKPVCHTKLDFKWSKSKSNSNLEQYEEDIDQHHNRKCPEARKLCCDHVHRSCSNEKLDKLRCNSRLRSDHCSTPSLRSESRNSIQNSRPDHYIFDNHYICDDIALELQDCKNCSICRSYNNVFSSSSSNNNYCNSNSYY